MSRVFQGKVRRVGNSLAVLILKEILEETGANEGDNVRVSILHESDQAKRRSILESVAGIYPNAKPFKRHRSDRSL